VNELHCLHVIVRSCGSEGGDDASINAESILVGNRIERDFVQSYLSSLTRREGIENLKTVRHFSPSGIA
jgi:hypothetical protein